MVKSLYVPSLAAMERNVTRMPRGESVVAMLWAESPKAATARKAAGTRRVLSAVFAGTDGI
jgi:hypothetical protein